MITNHYFIRKYFLNILSYFVAAIFTRKYSHCICINLFYKYLYYDIELKMLSDEFSINLYILFISYLNKHEILYFSYAASKFPII